MKQRLALILLCGPIWAGCSGDVGTTENQAPVARPGDNQMVQSGATVVLDGSGSSDPDGDALSFTWNQLGGDPVDLTGAQSATAHFTAPAVASDSTLSFLLEVSDGRLSAVKAVTITVNGTDGVGGGAGGGTAGGGAAGGGAAGGGAAGGGAAGGGAAGGGTAGGGAAGGGAAGGAGGGTPVVCPPSLQTAINNTASGATLDITGCTYSGAFTINNRTLTLKGGTLKPPSGAHGLAITQGADVVIDGLTVDCAVTAFSGIWADRSPRLNIKNVNVHDCVYAGVMILSGVNGSVTSSRVSNIGVVGYEANGMNAYGIALSDTGGPPSTGVAVTGNTIDNVPQWHGIDTHGGRMLTITDNVIHRCNRAIFLTPSTTNGAAQDIVASRNVMDTPTRRVDVLNTYPYNEVGLTVVSGTLRASGDANTFDHWPTGNHLDTQGGPNGFTNNVVMNPQ